MPPYKKPPYADGEKPYINQYPFVINNDNFKKARIPKTDGVDLFGYPGEAIDVGGFVSIGPVGKRKVSATIEENPNTALVRYDYEMENGADEPLFQFTLEAPASALVNIDSPPGWQFVLWDSDATPDMTPDAIQSVPFGEVPDDMNIDVTQPMEGVLWFTLTNPLLSNSTLSGFSFEASNIYPVVDDLSLAMLSNGRSTAVDASSQGLVTEFLFAPGPLVPEPTAGLGAILPLLLARRRSKETRRIR
jgi:hypothetical protein